MSEQSMEFVTGFLLIALALVLFVTGNVGLAQIVALGATLWFAYLVGEEYLG